MAITLSRPNLAWSQDPKRERLTRDEYHALRDNTSFVYDKQYELIDGDLVEQVSQKQPHTALVMKWLFAFARIFGEAYLWCQMPAALSEYSEPEPDVMVTTQTVDTYLAARTTPAAADVTLVLEVSVSTLSFDTQTKAPLYARSGIAECWILDVEARALIVHRDPTAEGYATVFRLLETEAVSPLSKPEATFKVSDYLP